MTGMSRRPHARRVANYELIVHSQENHTPLSGTTLLSWYNYRVRMGENAARPLYVW